MRLTVILLIWVLSGLSARGQMIPEQFVHCFGNDTLLIEKISETVSGDTVIKEFRDHTFAPDTSFNYYFYNDSVFIKYNNEFYMIGDNNAQVGDVWHPIRFFLTSYTDTTENCPFLMNLEVTAVDTISIDGVPTNYFSLKEADWATPSEMDYKFLAGIGATVGGPMYNLSQVMPCDLFTGVLPLFRSYRVGDFVYTENTCITSVNDLDETSGFKVFPNPTNGKHIFISSDDNKKAELVRLYDAFGKLVIEKASNTKPTTRLSIDVSTLHAGIYFVEVQAGNQRFTQKVVKTD